MFFMKDRNFGLSCWSPKFLSILQETRLLTLIEGVLAANIFDWGSRACVELYHKGTIIEIYRMSRNKMQRPWRVNGNKYVFFVQGIHDLHSVLKKLFACIVIQVDDFDVFKERMLGSGDKKPRPHKRALLFVDNSGADVVLGMLPLARELLQRGTEVSLLLFDASEKRLVNDLCTTHHFFYSGCFGCELPSCTKWCNCYGASWHCSWGRKGL